MASEERTYALADLERWEAPGVSLAVLGYPVRHSISPQMHNAALAALAKEDAAFAAWRYVRFETPPDRLLEALPVFSEKGFRGLNLTLPHKTVAYPAVAVAGDDAVARQSGAVNTLAMSRGGYVGYNTDGYGLERGVRRSLGRALGGSTILLLGAGGASRAAAAQCLTSGCARLIVANRNPERLEGLIEAIRPLAERRSVALEARPLDDPALRVETGWLVVNATSLGLDPADPLPLAETALAGPADLYDMVYNSLETPLMRAFVRRGGKAANGLSMLVYQGARSLELWTGRPAPVEAMFQAAQAALSAGG